MHVIDSIIKYWVEGRLEGHKTEHDIVTWNIADRLLLLANEAYNEDDQEPMDRESLNDLLDFLDTRPSLTLSPNGHISASWIIADHKLIVRFMGGGKTQTLLRKIDDKQCPGSSIGSEHRSSKSRVAGSSPARGAKLKGNRYE